MAHRLEVRGVGVGVGEVPEGVHRDIAPGPVAQHLRFRHLVHDAVVERGPPDAAVPIRSANVRDVVTRLRALP